MQQRLDWYRTSDSEQRSMEGLVKGDDASDTVDAVAAAAAATFRRRARIFLFCKWFAICRCAVPLQRVSPCGALAVALACSLRVLTVAGVYAVFGACIPIIIAEMAIHHSERHVIAWFVAGVAVIFAVPLTIHDGSLSSAACRCSRPQ